MLELLHAHLSEPSVDCSLEAFARVVIDFPADGGDLGGPVGAIERIDMELLDDVLESIVVPDGWGDAELREPRAEFVAVGRVPVAVIFAAGRVIVAVALSSIPV